MWVIRKTEKDPSEWLGGPHWLMEWKKGFNAFNESLSGAFVFGDKIVAENLMGMLKRKGEKWEVVPLAEAIRELEVRLSPELAELSEASD
jgi:hypothetical protein